MSLNLRPSSECTYDIVSLGEVMLRLDPGEGRVRTARSFRASEGGGDTTLLEAFDAALVSAEQSSRPWFTMRLAACLKI